MHQKKNFNDNNHNSGFKSDCRKYRFRPILESSGSSGPAFSSGQLNKSFESGESSFSNASRYRNSDSDGLLIENNYQQGNTRDDNSNNGRNNYSSARKNN